MATNAAAVRSQLGKRPRILRLHQEDMCQALGLPPTAKYQSDGGPGPADIVTLLKTHSSKAAEDLRTFLDTLAFNWIIAGTDAHAKNYSLLHGTGGRVRLAPLYDLVSVLPYSDFDPRHIKLAMKIGGKYRVRDIGWHQWEKLAIELRLDPQATVDRIKQLVSAVPDLTALVQKQMTREGLRHPVLTKLAQALTARASKCLREMP
jgi:serine/threonine-protein kinase HipA